MTETKQGQKNSNSKIRITIIAAVILGLAIGLLLGLLTIGVIRGDLSFFSPGYRGIELPTPRPIDDFTLVTHTGKVASLSDFRDRITLLYFGYTYCPDVCPDTLTELVKAMDALDPQEREKIQVIMVTVDPARDTPDVLADYLDHFDPSFIGLTGGEEEIREAANSVGIFINKQPGSIESGYLIDHTASISVVDQDGSAVLMFKFGTPAEDIAADLKRLLKEQ